MEQITCPTCTLLNNSTNINCDVCDSILRPEEEIEETNPLEDEFMQITGSTRSEAQEYLKTTNNNIESAISYYFSDKEMGISNSEYINRQNIVISFLELLNSSTTNRYQKPSNTQDLTCQLLYSRGTNKPHYCEICDSNAYLTAIKIISMKGSTSDIIRLIPQEDITELKITEDKYDELVNDVLTHIENDFIPTVQQRGAAIIKARGASSAASAANAAIDHMRDWTLGTPDGDWVSMAIPSDGSYGIPEGIISSFPVTCKDGDYELIIDF